MGLDALGSRDPASGGGAVKRFCSMAVSKMGDVIFFFLFFFFLRYIDFRQTIRKKSKKNGPLVFEVRQSLRVVTLPLRCVYVGGGGYISMWDLAFLRGEFF